MFSSAPEPAHPDKRKPHEPLQHVTLTFEQDWQPEAVLAILFANESRFTEHWHLKFQAALEPAVGLWAASGGGKRVRTITFKQRIDNPLSPVRASHCIWSQWLLLSPTDGLVYETKSDLTEVPFGDAWSLYQRWVFRPAENGHGSRVTLSVQSVFHKYFLWRAKVDSEGVRIGKEAGPSMLEMIQSYLLEHQPASMPRRFVRLTRTLADLPPPPHEAPVAPALALLPPAGQRPPPVVARGRVLSVEAALVALVIEEDAKLSPRTRQLAQAQAASSVAQLAATAAAADGSGNAQGPARVPVPPKTASQVAGQGESGELTHDELMARQMTVSGKVSCGSDC